MKPDYAALHRIDIETPCTASWAAMEGDDRVRHCSDCNKSVYNLSAMKQAEASALLAADDGSLCVRFFRRPDGTVMTSDCSSSMRAASRRTLRRLPGAAGAAMLAMSFNADAAPPGPPAAASAATVQPMPLMGAPAALRAEPQPQKQASQPEMFVVGRPMKGSSMSAGPQPIGGKHKAKP